MPTNEKSALIIGHVQPPITGLLGDNSDFLPQLRDTVATAHASDVPVIFVHIGFHKNISDLGVLIDGVSNPFDETVAPEEKDIVVRATGVSGFFGTDLESVLRTLGVERIVLTGISTGGVVLGTLTDAVQRGFKVTVLSDLAFDPSPEIHDALLSLVGESGFGKPWGATVETSKEWSAALGSA